jgi:hypothetical protein
MQRFHQLDFVISFMRHACAKLREG